MQFTKELLNLTAKLAKGVTEKRGHLLLIGKSGIGRKTAIKILSALFGHKLLIPAADNDLQFNNDLKMVINKRYNHFLFSLQELLGYAIRCLEQ